jgi:5-formyltetrahydrofolate cyclo-ligase
VTDRLLEAARAKQEVRERMWSLLEQEGVARFPGARGRIPNFAGAEAAAERLAGLPEWRRAAVIKANPDAPQLSVRARARALEDGKRLCMAVPRLRAENPFLRIDPDRLSRPSRRAASIKGAAKSGRPVAVGDMEPIDMVVCGSVAVGRNGVRVGKGGGCSDLELGLLAEAGLVHQETVFITTVHPLQVLEEELPETGHDFRVHRIVTPQDVIRTGARRSPAGILWDHLDEDKIAAVPALAGLAEQRLS